MNIIKVSGTKEERIIGGKRYLRQDKTVLALKDFNSYVDSNFNSYDYYIKKAYGEITRGIDVDKEGIAVLAEIIRKGRNRYLYLTLFKIDKDYVSRTYEEIQAEKQQQLLNATKIEENETENKETENKE